MKIIFVVPSLRKCGPVNVLLGLIKNLASRHDLIVFSIYSGRDEKDLLDGLSSYKVTYKPLRIRSTLMTSSAIDLLQTALDDISPDIVHSHGLQADYCVSKLRGDFKKLSTLHSNIIEDYRDQFGVLSSALIPFRIRMMKKFDLTICCSKSVYDVIKSKSRSSMIFIRNGVTIVKDYNAKVIRRNINKELDLPDSAKIFLYCGVLIRRKRVPELIELFIKNAKNGEYLVIIGDGEDWDKCKIAASNSEKVRLLGKRDDPSDYFIASDIYVSNSASEGLSMSTLEALSFDDLLFLSDIPSHRESLSIIDNMRCGEVFTKENYGKMYKKVLNMSSKHIRINKDILSDRRMSREYESAYKEIIKND